MKYKSSKYVYIFMMYIADKNCIFIFVIVIKIDKFESHFNKTNIDNEY